MYFEALTHGSKYFVKVDETRKQWNVSLKKEDGDWVDYKILKQDFRTLEETISFMFNNNSYLVDVIKKGTDYSVYTRGSYRNIKIYNDEMILHESLKSSKGLGAGKSLTSGMPGKILKIFVKPGDEVKEGEALLIMEAMKMENEMRADKDCIIKTIHVEEGSNVESGAGLIDFQ